MADNFSETIEKLKTEIATHVSALKAETYWAQIEKLYRALNTIEELAEAQKTTLAELFGFADSSSSVVVGPGEFMGQDALEAAKAYMEKKKAVAASLDEIVEALKTGGANPIGRDTLAMSLARSTWDVLKAPGQELYRLVKYAPNVRRGKKKKAAGQVEATEEPTDDVGEDSATAKVSA